MNCLLTTVLQHQCKDNNQNKNRIFGEKSFFQFLYVTLFVFLFIVSSKANIFPNRIGNLDVIYTNNSKVDLALKMWMIDNAKYSVALTSFMFGKDQYGMSIIRALRNAANRGVKVRVIYESSTSRLLGDDLFLIVSDLLSDPGLKIQPEIITMGLAEKLKTQLAINDYIHEKIFITDSGHDSELIYIGGRDISDFAKFTVDSGYFLRPITKDKVYVGTDIKNYYDDLWILLRQFFTIEKGSFKAAQSALKKVTNIKPVTLDSYENNDFIKKVNVLSRPPSIRDELYDFQFRPYSATMVSNDLLKRILYGKYEKKMSVREELISSDDILNYINNMLRHASKTSIVSYSSDFPLPLIDSLKDFLTRGKSISIYTNDKDAMAGMDNVGISELSYEFSISALKSLNSFSTISNQSELSLFGLNRDLVTSQTHGAQNYLHRKLMLLDDYSTVTGSYNFTNSSSTKNNEFIINFYDRKMNFYLNKEQLTEQKKYYRSLMYDVLTNTKDFFVTVKKSIVGDFVKSQF